MFFNKSNSILKKDLNIGFKLKLDRIAGQR